MESELRKRFVIVTALLVTIVLAVFYTATHFYYSYWFDQDTLSFIDWVADSKYSRITIGITPDIYETGGFTDSDSVIAAIVTPKGDLHIE